MSGVRVPYRAQMLNFLKQIFSGGNIFDSGSYFEGFFKDKPFKIEALSKNTDFDGKNDSFLFYDKETDLLVCGYVKSFEGITTLEFMSNPQKNLIKLEFGDIEYVLDKVDKNLYKNLDAFNRTLRLKEVFIDNMLADRTLIDTESAYLLAKGYLIKLSLVGTTSSGGNITTAQKQAFSEFTDRVSSELGIK